MSSYYSQTACFFFTYGVVARMARIHNMLSSVAVEELETTLSDLHVAYPKIYAELTLDDVRKEYEYEEEESHTSVRTDGCLGRLRESAYDIECMLDVAATDLLSLQVYGIRANASQIDSGNLADSIGKLRQSLSELLKMYDIAEQARTIHSPVATFVSSFTEVTFTSFRYYGGLWSLPEDTIVGRQSEKNQIMRWMFTDKHWLIQWIFGNQKQHPIVISIRGEAGIGKTSLAKMIYNDNVQVSARFDLVSWSFGCSRSTDLKCTVVEIIRSFTNQSQFYLQRMHVDTLKDTLRGILAGQKYLLVLDDFRVGLKSGWKELREILEVGVAGSTVLMVTSIGWNLDPSITRLELQGLPEDECWSLFAWYAGFNEEAEQNYPSLTSIGRSLVYNCDGCTLAIKTLGSMLRTNRDEHSWRQIQESKIWNACYYERATPAFQISIEHMSCDLLQCLYLSSILCKDTVMPRDQLIFAWMALGLLHSRDENEDPIDIGNRYCNDLAFRCFVQLFQRHGQHMVLVHNQQLKLERMLEEVEFLPNLLFSPDNCRYVIWNGDESTSKEGFGPDHSTLPTVRTFLFENYVGSVSKFFLEDLISKLNHARILLLDGSEFEELPETIGNLKLLRYLSLAGNHTLKELPESVCNLLNLQTLDLSGCELLQSLPENMHKLVSLRHLFLSFKLTNVPEIALQSWTSLRHFKICSSPNLNSLSEAIANLTALKVLEIHDCPSIASLPDNINNLTSLSEISILNCEMLDLTNWGGLEGLTSLEFLQIQSLPKLTKFPKGLESSVDSLRHLVVSNCQSLIALPECLHECINLIEMVIENCPELTTLPKGIHQIKTLQLLKIVNCPKLSARCQKGVGDDWHLISHIPHIQLLQNPAYQKRAFSALPVIGATSHEQSLENQEPEVEKKVESSKADASSQEAPQNLLKATENNMEKVKKVLTNEDEEVLTKARTVEETKDPCSILFLLHEDYEIEKEMLIQLWMAAEHIKDELHGEKYFSVIVANEYLLPCGTNFLTGKNRYRINPKKINEFLVTQKDNASYYLKWKKECRNSSMPAELIQHVSLGCSTEIDATTFQTLENFKQLRTLLFLGNHGHRAIQMPSHLFSSFNNLQALDLSRTHMKELPSSIGHMIHLRYLDLSWTLIERLPDIICSLAELQTLKLRGCTNLSVLPEQLNKLTKLRYLDVDVLGQIETMPNGLGELVHLRTLPAFLVGTEYGCKIQELKDLNKIAGNLCIAKLENVEDAEEAREAALHEKKQLQQLELRWTASEICGTHHDSPAILKCLKPCTTSLEELQITCYEGEMFPSWIGNPEFNRLAHIIFFGCENLLELPLLEQLPFLKHLELVEMNRLNRIGRGGELREEVVAFPKLEKLEINEMKSLEVWDWKKRDEGDYKSLTHVIIDDCPKLREFDVLPHLMSIKHFEIRDCPKLQSLSHRKLPDSLKELIVEDCPQIQEKCLEDEGDDWDKIKHVLNKASRR